MSKDILINLPASTDLSPSEVKGSLYVRLKNLGCDWPAFPALGTRRRNGRALLLIRLPRRHAITRLRNILDDKGIDYHIRGIKRARREAIGEGSGYPVDQAPVRSENLANFANISTYNPDGTVDTTRRPLATDRLYVGTYAGSEPIEV